MQTYKDNTISIGYSEIAMYTVQYYWRENNDVVNHIVHTGFDGLYQMHIIDGDSIAIPEYYTHLFDCEWFKIFDDDEATFKSERYARKFNAEHKNVDHISIYLAGATLLAKFHLKEKI